MAQAGIRYLADIPCSTRVCRPLPDHPDDLLWTVADIAHHATTVWHTLTVRATERGTLTALFAAVRVFTWRDEAATPEWLVLRKHTDGSVSYAFCNASEDTSLEQLASWKCARHFVERSIQDAKSEAGWADLRAQKYRAWEHHLALTVLATWFVAQTKLDWQRKYPPDPRLTEALNTDRLPSLSMANVRTLLRSVLPLPQLTPEEATRQVVGHLFNRTRSRKSRLKKSGKPPT